MNCFIYDTIDIHYENFTFNSIMKTFITSELKKEADELGLKLERKTRNELLLSTNIKLEQSDEKIEILFSFDTSNFNAIEETWVVDNYYIYEHGQTWAVINSYKHKQVKPLKLNDNESLKDYLTRVQEYFNSLIIKLNYNSKKRTVDNKKWEIENDDIIGKFNKLLKQFKGGHLENKTPQNSTAHQYHIWIEGPNSWSHKESLHLYERPKLKKWEIRNQWMNQMKIEVKNLNEAYEVIEWWLNRPQYDIMWR